jgi:hypothetical protein
VTSGNPLVDSVAEHQQSSLSAFYIYFGLCLPAAAVGLFFSLFMKKSDALVFFWLYLGTSTYFAYKMIRLLLLLAAPASLSCGIAGGNILLWCYETLTFQNKSPSSPDETESSSSTETFLLSKVVSLLYKAKRNIEAYRVTHGLKFLFALSLTAGILYSGSLFYSSSLSLAEQLSEPHIMLAAEDSKGNEVILDDYRGNWHLFSLDLEIT